MMTLSLTLMQSSHSAAEKLVVLLVIGAGLAAALYILHMKGGE